MAENAPRRRRRDPAERRRSIVAAATELVRELGSAGLTHRLVAERAGVPLGATTQYFATLDDLRAEALAALADEVDVSLSEVADALIGHGPSPEAFARTLHDYISDEQMARADMALLSAAMVDPHLRDLALRWSTGLIDLLSPHVGAGTARAVTAFVDGATIHALLHGTPMSVEEITHTLNALLTSGGNDVRDDR
ncbi:TetR/AcrR family transcriptional regulator [Gordonia soli]|uniref:Putative TetR family transcriptional regulator n=1 Tax=Gordonia soli NBRC 108243 TaxID=1223545 RepID=M0QFD1_9ACTN|nr:TetR family transcriptional regulator [Gordonia soli]GAC67310.1 putative TetR family transcriptional regulator [Gordonia soli NBRC 108243]